jgi:protease II
MQNTIDDFVADAQAAITDGWTSHAKLAGIGVGAGGFTIRGAVTQHPDLFSVAISQGGFSDMVDLENMPNGPETFRSSAA